MIPEAKVNPEYLHSNSTSHSWAFGAFAELIDNAHDAKAKNEYISYNEDSNNNSDAERFIIQDDGEGLGVEGVHNMMSFGFCKKSADVKNPIGMYGNGFKSGSMRLGKDVVVFTKNGKNSCIGMLSQSYLRELGMDTIQVPISSLDKPVEEDQSLQHIIKYSIFNSMDSIHEQLSRINTTGTRIVIYNREGNFLGNSKQEFDFSKSDDILLSEEEVDGASGPERPREKFSLRSYLEILYLTPRMKLHLRGTVVEARLMWAEILLPFQYSYKPQGLSNVNIILGYSPMHLKRFFGMMIYHKERLVKMYEPLPAQNRGQHLNIIGVIQTDAKPNHSKQDFEPGPLDKIKLNANRRLKEYVEETNPGAMSRLRNILDRMSEKMSTWSQCTNCSKWRRTENKYPEWCCEMDENTTCDNEEQAFPTFEYQEIVDIIDNWRSDDLSDDDFRAPPGSERKRKPESQSSETDSPSPSKKSATSSPRETPESPIPNNRLQPRRLLNDLTHKQPEEQRTNEETPRLQTPNSIPDVPPLDDEMSASVPDFQSMMDTIPSQDWFMLSQQTPPDKTYHAVPLGKSDRIEFSHSCQNNTNNSSTQPIKEEPKTPPLSIQAVPGCGEEDCCNDEFIDLEDDEVMAFLLQWEKDPEVDKLLANSEVKKSELIANLKQAYKRNTTKQQVFRKDLQNLNGGCVITGWSHEAVYEAAHIIPVIESDNYEATNGFLLRRDFHKLFDLHLWTLQITEDGANASIFYAKELDETIVEEFKKRLWWEKLRLLMENEQFQQNFRHHNQKFFDKHSQSEICEIKAI